MNHPSELTLFPDHPQMTPVQPATALPIPRPQVLQSSLTLLSLHILVCSAVKRATAPSSWRGEGVGGDPLGAWACVTAIVNTSGPGSSHAFGLCIAPSRLPPALSLGPCWDLCDQLTEHHFPQV